MAPMAPLGRQRAMELVAKGQLPIRFGSPHPHVAILEQEGKFRIRALVIDEAEAKRESQAALARGDGWMPENYFSLGRPTGKIFAESDTREGLLEKMKSMKWPENW